MRKSVTHVSTLVVTLIIHGTHWRSQSISRTDGYTPSASATKPSSNDAAEDMIVIWSPVSNSTSEVSPPSFSTAEGRVRSTPTKRQEYPRTDAFPQTTGHPSLQSGQPTPPCHPLLSAAVFPPLVFREQLRLLHIFVNVTHNQVRLLQVKKILAWLIDCSCHSAIW